MLLVPGASADVVNANCPAALSAPEPSAVVPSLMVTLPVGVVVPPATVAVNVTESPALEGFKLEVTTVVVEAATQAPASATTDGNGVLVRPVNATLSMVQP